jgi:hypothetical protein
MRILETPERLVIRVPDHTHHLDPESKFYEPQRRWLGIEWPNGQLMVHLMTYEESSRWLNGEEIKKDDA